MPSEPTLPLKPLRPSEDDCCHNDCSPHCVFDDYERQLERWEMSCERLLIAREKAAD